MMALDPHFENLARPLGHLVIEFNYLEIDLGKTISRLIRTDDLAGQMFASLPMNTKLSLIRSFAHRINEDAIRANLVALLKRVEKASDERNKYIHGEFMPIVDAEYQYQGMAHRRVKDPTKNFEDVESETLEVLADEVRNIAIELRMLTATMFDLDPD